MSGHLNNGKCCTVAARDICHPLAYVQQLTKPISCMLLCVKEVWIDVDLHIPVVVELQMLQPGHAGLGSFSGLSGSV